MQVLYAGYSAICTLMLTQNLRLSAIETPAKHFFEKYLFFVLVVLAVQYELERYSKK